MPTDQRIAEAIRQVTDLNDVLEFYVSNGTIDAYPAAQNYLRTLYECERKRREGGDALYPLAEFDTWSDLDLISFAMFAIGAIELVILHSENPKPTLVKWSIELAKVLTAVVSSRLTERPSTVGM
ncbi:MAG: hypothetical protein WBD31_01060 [Rubripirellula sp.]